MKQLEINYDYKAACEDALNRINNEVDASETLGITRIDNLYRKAKNRMIMLELNYNADMFLRCLFEPTFTDAIQAMKEDLIKKGWKI